MAAPPARRKSSVSIVMSLQTSGLLLLMLMTPTMEMLVKTAAGIPRIRPKNQPVRVKDIGGSLRLTCPVDSDPPAIVEWHHNGTTISPGWDRFKVNLNYTLLVNNLEVNDTGVYLCRAVNGFGSVDFKYFVYVTGKYPGNSSDVVLPPGESEETTSTGKPPHFPGVIPDSLKQQPAGSTAWLECLVEGKPRPQITWYKDGRPLTDPRFDGGGSPWSGFILRISNLTADDSGAYTCRARNRVGSFNFTYTLDVVASALTSDPPQFIPPYLENLTVRTGAPVSFHCRMTSNIQPNIHWLKRVDRPHDDRPWNVTIVLGGQKFIALQKGDVVTLKDGTYLSKLVLNSASSEDSGLYICAAANNQGFDFKSAHLSVLQNQQEEVTSSSFFPLLPIAAILFIVVIVSLACIFLRVYLMRVKANNPGGSNPTISKFKPSSFRPQKALPGFGVVLPDKSRANSHYTCLESGSAPRDDSSPLQSDPDEAARVVRALFVCRQTEDRALVETPCEGHRALSIQQHRHHHTHLHYKCREH